MKKTIFAGLLFTALTVNVAAQQQSDIPEYYLKMEDVASSLRLLPPPPEAGSAKFQYDHERYLWGKTQRVSPRVELANSDANVGGDGVPQAFSQAFGIDITRENCPQIYILVKHMREDAGDLATREAKNYYQRVRPFVLFNEPTTIPQAEPWFQKSPSYPSGHTAIGWATALVLAEINVENQNAILERGLDMGDSRVIAGFHYQSDVDNARIVAAAVVARLHADKAFTKQLAKAKKEFAKLKKQGKIRFE